MQHYSILRSLRLMSNINSLWFKFSPLAYVEVSYKPNYVHGSYNRWSGWDHAHPPLYFTHFVRLSNDVTLKTSLFTLVNIASNNLPVQMQLRSLDRCSSLRNAIRRMISHDDTEISVAALAAMTSTGMSDELNKIVGISLRSISMLGSDGDIYLFPCTAFT